MLERFAMYLLHDMPPTGWSAIFAGIAAIAGAGFYLEGKRIMRADSGDPQTRWLTAEGNVIQSGSYGVGPTFERGQRLARFGLTMTLISLVAYASFLLPA